MRTNVADTSIDAYKRIAVRTLKTQCDRIHEVIVLAMHAGHADMSLQEIKAAYKAEYGSNIDLSSVSGRVNSMVGTRLERLESTRPCSVTGRHVHPVRIPPMQKRLFT